MVRKLTLSAQPEVISLAKRKAKQRGTSVSALFSDLIRSLDERGERRGTLPGPLTRKATGLVKLPKGASDKKLIADALSERFTK